MQPPTHFRTSDTRKVHKVLVVRYCLLQGTEAPLFCLDNFCRQICYLLRAHIRNITERLLSMVNPTDYRPLLLFCVGSHDTAAGNLVSKVLTNIFTLNS